MDEGLELLHANIETGDDASDISSVSNFEPDETSLEDSVQSLRNDIEYLLDLSTRFEEPVSDIDFEEESSPVKVAETSDLVRLFTNRVLIKFPRCHPNLAEAIGRAKWESGASVQSDRDGRQATGDILQGTSEQAMSHVADVGSNTPADSSYHGGAGTSRASILQSQRNLKWLECFPQHLMAGPKASSKELSFSTREDWVAHLVGIHAFNPKWDDKTCPFCFEVIETGAAASMSHVAHHLEEVSHWDLPRILEGDASDQSRLYQASPTSGADFWTATQGVHETKTQETRIGQAKERDQRFIVDQVKEDRTRRAKFGRQSHHR
ncbi:hypothetical protein BJ170DRAFT_596021 [Xylariales sp. AK1849]|nr:hypothetical protein BJ170DRAFT_596021 [Xylariales sp. AK1849]